MEERDIELTSGRTHLRSEGRGRALVWTHGFLNSIAAEDAAQSWPALGGDLLELVTALGLERPIAGGASMGTATSLHAAVRNPGAFSGLLLVVPPMAWDTRKEQADLYRAGAALVEARGVAAYLDAMRAATSRAS